MSKQIIKNCFAPIPDECLGPQLKPIVYDDKKIDWALVPYTVAVGGNEENLVLQYKPVKKGECDLKEYIASFADEVGIQNILKKLAISGDRTLLNQTGREALCPDGGLEPVQDYTTVPKSKTEAFNAVVNGVAAFDNLPDDLKGKMSMEQFAQLVGQEELDAYIKARIEALTPKEGDK